MISQKLKNKEEEQSLNLYDRFQD